MSIIRYKLWRAKKTLQASRAFKRALFVKIEQQEFEAKIYWFQLHSVKVGFAVLAVILAGAFGTGTYAYSSSSVGEGSMLYPLKRKIEAVEVRFYNKPNGKVKFYIKQIERREAEHQKLERRIKQINPAQLEKAERNLQQAIEKLEQMEAKLDLEQNTELQQNIKAHLKLRRQYLNSKKQHLEALRQYLSV